MSYEIINVDPEVLENMKNNPSKYEQLWKLKEGSTVKLTSNEEAQFLKLNRKNFVGIIDGKTYNIPISMFEKVITEAKENIGYKTLKAGELFYINSKTDAVLFSFVGMEKGRIIGINPISKARTRIDVSLYAGKVSEIK